MSFRECSFPIKKYDVINFILQENDTAATRILDNSEERLMAETNQLLCKSDMMAKSNDGEDEAKIDEEEQLSVCGRIYRPACLLKNIPHM